MRWPSWISGFPDQKISRHSQWVNRTKDSGKSNTEHCGSSISNGSLFGDHFRRCSVDDSRIRSKTAPFSFENELVSTRPLYQRNWGGQIIINKTAQISKPSKSWFGCVRVKTSQWWNAAEKSHKHRQEAQAKNIYFQNAWSLMVIHIHFRL